MPKVAFRSNGELMPRPRREHFISNAAGFGEGYSQAERPVKLENAIVERFREFGYKVDPKWIYRDGPCSVEVLLQNLETKAWWTFKAITTPMEPSEIDDSLYDILVQKLTAHVKHD